MPSSQSPVKKFFIEEPYVSPSKPKNDTEDDTNLGRKKTPEKNDDAEQDLLAELDVDLEEPKPLVKIKDALEQAAIAEPAVAKAEIDEADKIHYCSKYSHSIYHVRRQHLLFLSAKDATLHQHVGFS